MSGRSTPKIYIDGQAGTTALKIFELIAGRNDLELLRIRDSDRKNESVRREAIKRSNLTILCLPDDAARQAAQWAAEANTRVIDASTAHRVSDEWVYGMPELGEQERESIREAQFVANPGCYPTSVILLLRPLIKNLLLSRDCPLTIHALSGYTGGGRQLIERWEDSESEMLSLPFSVPYGLDRSHKHIPEMMEYSGLKFEPQFLPRVGPFAQGMRVEIPLHATWLEDSSGADGIWFLLDYQYKDERFVDLKPIVAESVDEFRFDPRACNGTNRIQLTVCSHLSGHVLLVGILDNLGKGASGAAVQSMNLMLGFDESEGLIE